MTRKPIVRLVLLAVLVVVGSPAHTDEPDDTKESQKSAKINALLDKSIREFRFGIVFGQEASIQVIPAHRWTNDVRDSHSLGLLGIAVDHGKPLAAVATYIWSGKLMHELDSLSSKTFFATQGQATIWEPKQGLTFMPIPSAPAVDPTAMGRLRQMKYLASQFSVMMLGWRLNHSDREPLRLLPRELFRYKPETEDCVDGTLFVFALGTDPEAILAIEANIVDKQAQWQFALIRQTSAGLEAKHDGKAVWTAAPHSSRIDRQSLGKTIESTLDIEIELSTTKK